MLGLEMSSVSFAYEALQTSVFGKSRERKGATCPFLGTFGTSAGYGYIVTLPAPGLVPHLPPSDSHVHYPHGSPLATLQFGHHWGPKLLRRSHGLGFRDLEPTPVRHKPETGQRNLS